MSSTLDFLIIAASVVLAVRLSLTGLSRRYRAFFALLVFEVIRGVAFAPLNSGGREYYRLWVLTEPVEWLFYVTAVLEIYSLVLEHYRGLLTVGRWCLMTAVGIALVAAAGTLLAPSHYSHQSPLMTYYYLAERAVYFSLVVFLLTILALLLQYPIVLSRNIIAHSFIFSLYFLCVTFSYHLLTTRGFQAIAIVTYSMKTANLLVLGAWLARLTKAGEQRRQQFRPSWMPGQEDQLVTQLNQLNLAIQQLLG